MINSLGVKCREHRERESKKKATNSVHHIWFVVELSLRFNIFVMVKDHPYHDGNKRTAWVVAETFLELNGYELNTDDQDGYRIIMGVAAGELGEEHLFEWFDNRAVKMLI
jgi:death-on-curing family protein